MSEDKMLFQLKLETGRVEPFRTEEEAKSRQWMLRTYGIKSEVSKMSA